MIPGVTYNEHTNMSRNIYRYASFPRNEGTADEMHIRFIVGSLYRFIYLYIKDLL